jgi:NTE family protein
MHKPEDRSKELNELCEFGHPSALNIIRFQYKDKPDDLCSSDFEFSNKSLQEHYQAGIEDVKQALITPTWLDLIADDAGIVLHEF